MIAKRTPDNIPEPLSKCYISKFLGIIRLAMGHQLNIFLILFHNQGRLMAFYANRNIPQHPIGRSKTSGIRACEGAVKNRIN